MSFLAGICGGSIRATRATGICNRVDRVWGTRAESRDASGARALYLGAAARAESGTSGAPASGPDAPRTNAGPAGFFIRSNMTTIETMIVLGSIRRLAPGKGAPPPMVWINARNPTPKPRPTPKPAPDAASPTTAASIITDHIT